MSAAFVVPATLAEWELQRSRIRQTLRALLGPMLEQSLCRSATVSNVVSEGGVRCEKVQLANGAEASIPGWVLRPENLTGRAPAILYCHQHGDDYETGKDELFKAGPAPEPAGVALAKLGFVVLAIDAPCFGERGGRGPGGPEERGASEELSTSKVELWHGSSLWASILRDDLTALEYLRGRDDVDGDRVGVTGFSMGATRSWWLMALRDELKAGAAVCCATRYANLIEERALSAHGIYYFVPGMLRHFDTDAVFASIAPRPLLLLNGDRDRGSPVTGIHEIERVTRAVYDLHDAGPAFTSVIFPRTGHHYLPEMWARTKDWLKATV